MATPLIPLGVCCGGNCVIYPRRNAFAAASTRLVSGISAISKGYAWMSLWEMG